MAEEKPYYVEITQAGCQPCELLKLYVEQNDVQCEMLEIDVDISRDTLQKLYPSVKEEGFPFCTVDGKPVGNLIYYWESGL